MTTRREFLGTAGLLGTFPFFNAVPTRYPGRILDLPTPNYLHTMTDQSVIGLYGSWAAGLRGEGPGELSWRNSSQNNLSSWHEKASRKLEELLAKPVMPGKPLINRGNTYTYNGLQVEEISWDLHYGRPVDAVVLKPSGARGPLPGILALHDHGGIKYFGYKKITRTSDTMNSVIAEHQKNDYDGTAWANEIAARGYIVLVHDAFAFGSRRVMYADVAGITRGDMNAPDKPDDSTDDPASITRYNQWASEHESVMAKSLFCAGTTWPGVCLAEDQVALDILASREDVDPERIGCGGLSGGGLRTVYLAGTDDRIKCAVCAGFMTTWNDFLLNKSYTHTWMTYTPLLPKYMEFPEILGLRVPLPTLVLNNNEDPLYTLPEMRKADDILKQVYRKADAEKNYQCNFYPGGHKFDKAMQADAFDWFDKWLK